MPTYQYACTECGEPLEAVQSFSDDPLTECPACSGRLRKIYSAVGVVFKGSGFYRNDSRAGNGAKQTNGDSSGSSDSGSKSGESAGSSSSSGSSSDSASSSGSSSSGSSSTGSSSSNSKSTAGSSAA